MFPLTNNEPYIKATGERTTLGAMFAETWADITALETKVNNEIATRAELGAHNLLPFDLAAIKAANTSGTWSDNAYTYQGITVTFNADGTCTATGLEENEYKALGNVFIKYCPVYAYKAGNIISGCPAGGNVNTYSILLTNAAATQLLAYDAGNGGTYNTDVNDALISIRFMQNTVVESLTFKPMVTLATDTDTTRLPYAKTNRELTNEVAVSYNNTNNKISSAKFGHVNVVTFSGVSLSDGDSITDYVVSVPVASNVPWSVMIDGTSHAAMLVYLQNDGAIRIIDNTGHTPASAMTLYGQLTYIN